MIQAFVDRFMEAKPKMAAAFRAKAPGEYSDIVKAVIEVVRGEDEYNFPDPERIHIIDDGNNFGTLVFVIADGSSHPSTYWYVKIAYGSCSGCDTLESIQYCRDEPPDDSQVEGYMTLALHIVQGLKEMGDDA
jgi:hypothetical protein